MYKNDYRVWDDSNLKRVAKEIAERYRQTVKREQIAERRFKTSSLKAKRTSHLGTLSTVEEMPLEILSGAEAPGSNRMSEHIEQLEPKQLIVISAHPKQKDMVMYPKLQLAM